MFSREHICNPIVVREGVQIKRGKHDLCFCCQKNIVDEIIVSEERFGVFEFGNMFCAECHFTWRVFNKFEGECCVCKKDVHALQDVVNQLWKDYRRAARLGWMVENAQPNEEDDFDSWLANSPNVMEYMFLRELMIEHVQADRFPHFFDWIQKRQTYRPKYRKSWLIDFVIELHEGGQRTLKNARLMCTFCRAKVLASREEMRIGK